MKRTLRALSVVFGSAILLLGPGQAIAGDWWGGGKKDRDRIQDVRVCLDEHDRELRVKFKVKGGNNRRYTDYDVAAFLTGDAQCVNKYDKGWYDDEDVYFKDTCTKEEDARRTRGNKFKAELDLDAIENIVCQKNEVLEDLEIHKAKVVINDREFMAYDVDDCDDHWYDDDWHD